MGTLLIDGVERLEVELLSRVPLVLAVAGRAHRVREVDGGPQTICLDVDGRSIEGFVLHTATDVWVRLEGRTFRFEKQLIGAGHGARKGDEMRSEMPGTVVSVAAVPGQAVAVGDPLLTVESMKLQATITADRAAVVREVALGPGATFERGAVLVTFEPSTNAKVSP